MRRHFKTTVLLLLLLLVPLRGMAAIAMWHCADNQRNSMTVSAHQHAEPHSSHGEPGVSHSAHQHHESPPHHTPPTEPGSQGASACSACAACCMGGSISAPGLPSFFFAPLGASRIAFVEPHFTGVVPAQLERPPLAQTL